MKTCKSAPLVSVLALVMCVAGQAQAQAQNVAATAPSVPPPILEAETSGTMTLPPATPHRLFLHAGDGFTIVNGDTAKVEGTINGNYGAVLAVSPDNSRFFVSESYWARENRGERVDLVSIYDGTSLLLTKEIKLPGRLIASGRMPFFSINASGDRGYVFNLEPASSVQVVDLDRGKYVSTIEIPGCGLIFPFRNEGFSSLCADGSLATVMVNAKGTGEITHSKPFFEAEVDPIFEESVVDRATGLAFFISYTGKVYPVTLGREPMFAMSWSLQGAAGLPAAIGDVQIKTWRPGGRRPFAYHSASKTLYVLMHEGKHWSQKAPGTEVWSIDVTTQQINGRFPLPTAGRVVGISQDASPLLYVAGDSDYLWILNPETGKIIRQVDELKRANLIAVTGF